MNEDTSIKNKSLIKDAYAAFNARNIDAILQVMHPEVKWANAWEGDYAIGHDEVRAYWERQWKDIDPKVTPVGFHDRANGTLEVEVDQLVKDLDGHTLFNGKVKHIYIITNGFLQQMDIEKAEVDVPHHIIKKAEAVSIGSKFILKLFKAPEAARSFQPQDNSYRLW